jgi:predicted metal-dependent RNase
MSEGIIHDLLSGELDSKLDQIQEAIKERRKLLRATKAASSMLSLKAGDRVSLHGLSPKKINGMEGKVISKQRTRVLVDMGMDSGYGQITVPAQCLNKVEVTDEQEVTSR